MKKIWILFLILFIFCINTTYCLQSTIRHFKVKSSVTKQKIDLEGEVVGFNFVTPFSTNITVPGTKDPTTGKPYVPGQQYVIVINNQKVLCTCTSYILKTKIGEQWSFVAIDGNDTIVPGSAASADDLTSYLQKQEGDPIGTANGNFTYSVEDSKDFSDFGPQLFFRRTYKSNLSDIKTNHIKLNGYLGVGWVDNINVFLTEDESTGEVSYLNEDGNIYTSPNAWPGNLILSKSYDNNEGNYKFQITDSEKGLKYIFKVWYTVQSPSILSGQLSGWTSRLYSGWVVPPTPAPDDPQNWYPVYSYWPKTIRYDRMGDNIFPTQVDFETKTYVDDKKYYLYEIRDRNDNYIRILHDYNSSTKQRTCTFVEKYNKNNTRISKMTFSYSGNRITTMTDPLGRVTYYSYLAVPDGSSDLSFVQRPDSSQNANYYYDIRKCFNGSSFYYENYLTHITDPRAPKGNTANSFVYNYGTKGEAKEIDYSSGRKTTLNFDYVNNRTIITNLSDGVSRTSIDQYSSDGHLLSSIDALGNVVSYAYDGGCNKIASITDAKGTTYYKYQNGMCTRIIDPVGNSIYFEYSKIDYFYVLTKKILPNGQVTQYGYDSKGNLTAIDIYDHSDGTLMSHTAYAYDNLGLQISMTKNNGVVTACGYDGNCNLSNVIIDPTGLNIVKQYNNDLIGRCLSVQDCNNKITTFAWNNKDVVTNIQHPDFAQITYTYNSNGDRTSITDANGKTTNFNYDSSDRLTDVYDAESGHTQYVYDGFGNKTAVIDANGNRTDYVYDALDRLTKTTYPASAKNVRYSSYYNYDAVGNLIQKSDPGNIITTFEYDKLNRLIKEISPTHTAVFQYDNVGNRIYASDSSSGAYTYTHDGLNRILTVSFSPRISGTSSYTLSYTYDSAGNIKTVTCLNKTITYYYDNANRITKINHSDFGDVLYEYDKIGNRTKMTYPNGVYTTYSYDPNNYRLLSIKHFNKLNTIIDHYDYTYDNVGNRLTMTNNLGTTSYSYNNIYELLSASTPERGTYEYSYDPVGNRTYYKRTKDNVILEEVSDYQYTNANELIKANGIAYSYSPNGNLVSKRNYQYFWNAKNELVSAVCKDNETKFVYDVNGRRIQSKFTINNALCTTNYIFDGMELLFETNQNGNTSTEYLNGATEVLGKKDKNGNIYYFLQDGLGSTTYLLDNLGNIVNTYYYEPFGKCWNVGHDCGDNVRYTGKECEEGIGLYYFGARWYDADSGRWTSRDPMCPTILNPKTLNKYMYCSNNPVTRIDLFGLCDDEKFAKDWASVFAFVVDCYTKGVLDVNAYFEVLGQVMTLADLLQMIQNGGATSPDDVLSVLSIIVAYIDKASPYVLEFQLIYDITRHYTKGMDFSGWFVVEDTYYKKSKKIAPPTPKNNFKRIQYF